MASTQQPAACCCVLLMCRPDVGSLLLLLLGMPAACGESGHTLALLPLPPLLLLPPLLPEMRHAAGC